MIGAEFSMQFIASIRQKQNWSISVAQDDLAREWQKRNRQLAKFRKSVFHTLKKLEEK